MVYLFFMEKIILPKLPILSENILGLDMFESFEKRKVLLER